MLTPTAPDTGAIFQRLDLPTVIAGLETLKAQAQQHDGFSDDQQYWFQRYLNAWDYYRDSQPATYQESIELLISEIFGSTVFA